MVPETFSHPCAARSSFCRLLLRLAPIQVGGDFCAREEKGKNEGMH